MATLSPDAMAQAQAIGVQLLQQCTAGAPNGTNLYAYCAHSIRYFLQPPAYSWVPGLLIALSVLYAILCLTFGGLLALRSRWGKFWLFRREATAYGTVITAHTINFTLIMSCLFFGLGLGTIWTIYQIATVDSVDQLVSSQLFSGSVQRPAVPDAHSLSYFPIWLYAWTDACSIFLSAFCSDDGLMRVDLSNWRNQPRRQHGSKRAIIYNIVAIGMPIAVLVVLCVLFSQMAMQGMQPAIDAANTMRQWLYKVAPTWTGQVIPSDLMPLVPVIIQLLAGANEFDHWQRIAFGFWIAAVGILYLAWIPLVILHVKQLLGQIKLLRGTIDSLNRTRGSPSSAQPAVPTYAIGNEKAQRVSIADSAVPRQADEAERRIRWLLRVCIFRIATAFCITIGIGIFASIIFLVVIDPRGAASNQSKNFYCRIGALFVPLCLAAPGLLIAIQHPRQTEGPMRGYDVFSQLEQSHISMEQTSPWKGLDSVSRGSPDASDKASDKDDADSAIFSLPTVNDSPVRLQHPAQHVIVEVETVVHTERPQ